MYLNYIVHVNLIDDFKKMYKQKFKEREKAFVQQQKELKSLKAHGKSKAHAVSFVCVHYGEREREVLYVSIFTVGSSCKRSSVEEKERRRRRRWKGKTFFTDFEY